MEPVVQTELDELRERVAKLEQQVRDFLLPLAKNTPKADVSPTEDTPATKKAKNG